MTRLAGCLCFFASLTAFAFGTTHFAFTGSVECEYKSFDYAVVLYENDFSSDDIIGCAVQHANEFSVAGTLETDGLFDHNYELQYKITHNCGSDQVTRVLYLDMGMWEITEGVYTNHTIINLSNKGAIIEDEKAKQFHESECNGDTILLP